MKKNIFFLTALISFMLLNSSVYAKLKVVTTSTDLASIARSIGTDRVSVESLARADADLHYLQARPDYIIRLNRADVFIQVGMELESGWVPSLLQQSRNSKIRNGGAGYCDASENVKILEKKSGTLSRGMGDVHPSGNPHYWTDPVNGIIIAKNIMNTFIRVDSANASFYRINFNIFKDKIIALTKTLLEKMKPHRKKSVAVYHSEFIYLLNRFGLQQSIMIEELPGVAPSPWHLNNTVKKIKNQNISLILAAPWSSTGYAKKVSRESGVPLSILPIHSGYSQERQTYEEMIEECVAIIIRTIQ